MKRQLQAIAGTYLAPHIPAIDCLHSKDRIIPQVLAVQAFVKDLDRADKPVS
jgi:hypothetical protein